ncbi:MAG: 50S ribosomal protein L16 [Candidatus Gracilibacteria bacterium]
MKVGEINSRQIEAARRAMTHFHQTWRKDLGFAYSHTSLSLRKRQVPMGSGKGTVEKYVAAIRAGTVLFEMDGVEMTVAKEAMRLASQKLPVKCRFIDSTVKH